MHADRTNRFAATLLAFLLLVTGVLGTILSSGGFGRRAADRRVADNVIWDYFAQQGHWLWPVIAVACVPLLALSLIWLVKILGSTDRVSQVTVSGTRETGRTTLSTSAITNAVATEVDNYYGVNKCSARMVGSAEDPRLIIETILDDQADVAEVRRRIEHEAVVNARRAMDKDRLPITIQIGVSKDTGTRVQ